MTATRTYDKTLTFDSLQAASAATGIPLGILRGAKRKGCPAFQHSRVDLFAFLRWQFNKGNAPSVPPADQLALARAERERHRLAVEEGKYIPRDEVAVFIQRTFSPVRERLMGLPGRITASLNLTAEQRRAVEAEVQDTLRHCRESIPPLSEFSKPDAHGAEIQSTGATQIKK